mgnify:FL=1
MSDETDEQDERASRMAQKRRNHEQRKQRQQDKAGEPHKTDEASEVSEPSEPHKTSEADKSDDEEPVGTYMYLPPSLKDDLGYRYQELKLELSREFDVPMDDVEKNAHFYPAVIKYGLETVTAEHIYEEIEE